MMRIGLFRRLFSSSKFPSIGNPPLTFEAKSTQIAPVEKSRIIRIESISGIPPAIASARQVYIYQPSRSAMQSGSLQLALSKWKLDFDKTQPRWENPMVGWISSRDPVQAVALEFERVEDAIAFAERNGWQWKVREGQRSRWNSKSYAENFTYSKDKLKTIPTK
jgi:NADH dehydrogenase (ubiquinone) Fe-S protein 4